MLSNIVNYALSAGIAVYLYLSDVPLEMALQVGLLALIACSLADISHHLRRE